MVYKIKHSVRDEAAIKSLLQRMPDSMSDSFSDEQLNAINVALAGRNWGKHPVDIRGTISFWRNRYYFVLLAGKDLRALSRSQQKMGKIALALLIVMLLLASATIGLVILYVIKSALGINLFENYSLGLWDWIKSF